MPAHYEEPNLADLGLSKGLLPDAGPKKFAIVDPWVSARLASARRPPRSSASSGIVRVVGALLRRAVLSCGS